MNKHMVAVELEKAYRLLNHGPTVLVSATHDGVDNVMAAAWSCALDFSPPKVTLVLDKATSTRGLVEGSGYFALQVPNVGQVQLTYEVGNLGLADAPDKLKKCGIELFRAGEQDTPLVSGCSAWLICKVIPEPHIQQTYDLFIGEVVAAWADDRVFRNGHWEFDKADPSLRSLHYIAGGQFYAIGESVLADTGKTRDPEA